MTFCSLLIEGRLATIEQQLSKLDGTVLLCDTKLDELQHDNATDVPDLTRGYAAGFDSLHDSLDTFSNNNAINFD